MLLCSWGVIVASCFSGSASVGKHRPHLSMVNSLRFPPHMGSFSITTQPKWKDVIIKDVFPLVLNCFFTTIWIFSAFRLGSQTDPKSDRQAWLSTPQSAWLLPRLMIENTDAYILPANLFPLPVCLLTICPTTVFFIFLHFFPNKISKHVIHNNAIISP